MPLRINLPKPFFSPVLVSLIGCIFFSSCAVDGAPILQPGAPGDATRLLDADKAISIAKSSYTLDDVRFMQDMILHHHQATLMA